MRLPNLILNILGVIACAMALCACGTFAIPELDSDVNYQRDLKFKVQHWRADKKKWSKEKTYVGVGVVPKAKKYKVTIFAIGKADMITLSSCHREIKRSNPESDWWSSGVEIEFTPTHIHETEKACPMDIGIYEKKKGRHGWASIVIDSDRENLPALVKCNGEVKNASLGSSFCQAKKGLVQSIHFKKDVEVVEYADCVMRKPDKGYGKDWTYIMPPGRCVFFFTDRNNPDNLHKSVHFGYDTIPIRGVE